MLAHSGIVMAMSQPGGFLAMILKSVDNFSESIFKRLRIENADSSYKNKKDLAEKFAKVAPSDKNVGWLL